MITFNLKMQNGMPIPYANYVLYHNNTATQQRGVTDKDGQIAITDVSGLSGKVSIKLDFTTFIYITANYDFVDGSVYNDDGCQVLLCDAGVKLIINNQASGICDSDVYNADTNERIKSFRFDSNGWYQIDNMIYQKIYFKTLFMGEWKRSKDFLLAPLANPYLVISEFWSGGIEEAPIDNKLYGRKNKAWSVVTGGGGGDVEEAPIDGKEYVRKDAGWTENEARWC